MNTNYSRRGNTVPESENNMPKPVCVKCERFYRPKKNGTTIIEMMPVVPGACPGTSEREKWKPYKLWMSDLWQCQGCGHELVVGFGQNPIAEHYQENFNQQVEERKAALIINDC